MIIRYSLLFLTINNQPAVTYYQQLVYFSWLMVIVTDCPLRLLSIDYRHCNQLCSMLSVIHVMITIDSSLKNITLPLLILVNNQQSQQRSRNDSG